jgi:hypothetical protein
VGAVEHGLVDRGVHDPAEHQHAVAEPEGRVQRALQRHRRGHDPLGPDLERGLPLHPTASNSLTERGKSVPVALTCSNRCSGARFTTNSPVASTLSRESLRPTEVNCTIGGETQATVKNECGARLSTPSADTEETHAIGRGTTTAVSSL